MKFLTDNKSDSSSDASVAAPSTAVVWVVNVVVVAATAGVVLWMWHKVKCSTGRLIVVTILKVDECAAGKMANSFSGKIQRNTNN